AAFGFASVNETSLAVGPSPNRLAAHHRRLDLRPVDKSHHPQARRLAIMRARGRYGLPDEFGGGPGFFLSESGVNPRAYPRVLDVLSERRGCDPEGARAVGKENHAAAGRGELRRADLLPIVVAISEARGNGIGPVRRAPAHLRHVARKNFADLNHLHLAAVCGNRISMTQSLRLPSSDAEPAIERFTHRRSQPSVSRPSPGSAGAAASRITGSAASSGFGGEGSRATSVSVLATVKRSRSAISCGMPRPIASCDHCSAVIAVRPRYSASAMLPTRQSRKWFSPFFTQRRPTLRPRTVTSSR